MCSIKGHNKNGVICFCEGGIISGLTLGSEKENNPANQMLMTYPEIIDNLSKLKIKISDNTK